MRGGFIPQVVAVGYCDEGHREVRGRQDGGDSGLTNLGVPNRTLA